MNEKNVDKKKEEENISLLTESSLNISRAFEAGLSDELDDEKKFGNFFFRTFTKF